MAQRPQQVPSPLCPLQVNDLWLNNVSNSSIVVFFSFIMGMYFTSMVPGMGPVAGRLWGTQVSAAYFLRTGDYP